MRLTSAVRGPSLSPSLSLGVAGSISSSIPGHLLFIIFLQEMERETVPSTAELLVQWRRTCKLWLLEELNIAFCSHKELIAHRVAKSLKDTLPTSSSSSSIGHSV